MSDKKEIRKLVRNEREQMKREDMFSKSNLIFERLITVPEYKRAEKIYTYVSLNNEVDTIMLIDYSLSMEKRVFVPRISISEKKKTMEFYEISDISELSPGYMGIFEPDINGKEPDNLRNGVMILPVLAFDGEYNRLGYGGGFYDRYLQEPDKLYKIGIAYEFQKVSQIPCEEHDVKPDMIITEEKTYRRLDY